MSDERMPQGDLVELERELERWVTEAERSAECFTAVREQIAEVTVAEQAAGGAVRVTVGSGGGLIGLAFTDRVRSMRPDELAAQVMACVRRAQAGIADRVAGILARTVPDEGELADRIVGSFRERFPDPRPREHLSRRDEWEDRLTRAIEETHDHE